MSFSYWILTTCQKLFYITVYICVCIHMFYIYECIFILLSKQPYEKESIRPDVIDKILLYSYTKSK